MVEIDDDELLGSWEGSLFYVTGAVYAALVLLPYLPSLEGTFKLLALGLLFCGVLSYWLAVYLFGHLPDFVALKGQEAWLRDIYAFGITGVVGAVIVGTSARLLVPLALRWSGWLMLLGAGCLGGIVFSIGYNAKPTWHWGIDYVYWLPGHIAWQVLFCLALYYGSNRGSRVTEVA